MRHSPDSWGGLESTVSSHYRTELWSETLDPFETHATTAEHPAKPVFATFNRH